MYQLVSAYGVLRDAEGKESPAPIDAMTLFQVFAQYSSIYAIVTTTTDPTEVAMDLYRLPYQVRYLNNTLQEWFSTIGNATLPTQPVPQGQRQAFVQFWNLFQEDFDIRLANRGIHPDLELIDDQEIDVLVSKPGANYEAINNYCLITVNGFIHRVDHNSHGVYALGGGRSRRHSGKSDVGLLDFQHIAPIKTIPITSDLLFKRDEAVPYSSAVYFKLPESIGQRRAMLVIGGWLHPLTADYSIVADNLIKFDTKNYPWFKRYIQTKDYLDLSELGIEKLPNGAYSQDQLYSDAVFEKWLTMEQSFIVLIDVPQLDVGFAELQATKLPGRYYAATKPQYPIVVGDGRLAEPVITFEKHKWVVALDNYMSDNLVFETMPWRGNAAIEYRRQSSNPTDYAQAKSLMISKLLG